MEVIFIKNLTIYSITAVNLINLTWNRKNLQSSTEQVFSEHSTEQET